jgi:hypothetical protein
MQAPNALFIFAAVAFHIEKRGGGGGCLGRCAASGHTFNVTRRGAFKNVWHFNTKFQFYYYKQP